MSVTSTSDFAAQLLAHQMHTVQVRGGGNWGTEGERGGRRYLGIILALGVRLAHQLHNATQPLDGLHLDIWGHYRHADDCLAALRNTRCELEVPSHIASLWDLVCWCSGTGAGLTAGIQTKA